MNVERHETIEQLRMSIAKPVVTFDWRQTPNESIVGTVIELVDVKTRYGMFPRISVDTGDQIQQLVATHRGLREQLADVAVGDLVGIKLDGTRQSRNGHRFYAWRLLRFPNVETFDHGDSL